jgi:hypothetical protein
MERGSFLWKRMIGQGVDVPISRLILAKFMKSFDGDKKLKITRLIVLASKLAWRTVKLKSFPSVTMFLVQNPFVSFQSYSLSSG